jgi:hypothetical protein
MAGPELYVITEFDCILVQFCQIGYEHKKFKVKESFYEFTLWIAKKPN